MSKKKDLSDNNVVKVFIVLVALTIVITIATIIVKYIIEIENKKYVLGNYTREDVKVVQDSVENYLKDKTTPKNMVTLYSKYTGDREMSDLYRSLYSFVNYLPTLSKKLNGANSEKINQFYQENVTSIKDILGIRNEETFERFINGISKYNFNKLSYEYCEIIKDSYKDNLSYLNMDIGFKYKENDEMIVFNVAFSTSKLRDPVVKINVKE